MIAVVQRVTHASVTVNDRDYHQSIGPGLLVLLGVEENDDEKDAKWMANKLANLRIFTDDQGKMNNSVQFTAGEILLISQFTLAGQCQKGNRPSFVKAADPEKGEHLYNCVSHNLSTEHNLPVRTGIFQTTMQVTLTNDGPVTLIVQSPKK